MTNKTYKVIRSQTAGKCMVTSELAKGITKSSSISSLFTKMTALMGGVGMVAGAAPVFAETCSNIPYGGYYNCVQSTPGENIVLDKTNFSVPISIDATTNVGSKGSVQLQLSNSNIVAGGAHGVNVRGTGVSVELNGNNNFSLSSLDDSAVLAQGNYGSGADASILVNGNLNININHPNVTNADGLEAHGFNSSVIHHGTGTIITNGGNAIWVNAIDSATVLLDNNTKLKVSGVSNNGINATSQNGNAVITSNAEISVSGEKIRGIFANVMGASSAGNAHFLIDDMDLLSVSGLKDVIAVQSRTNGFGDAIVQVGKNVNEIQSLADTVPTSSGNEGILAYSAGTGNSIIFSDAQKIIVSGDNNDGIYAYSANGNAYINASGTIITQGKDNGIDHSMFGIVVITDKEGKEATIIYRGNENSYIDTEKGKNSSALLARGQNGSSASVVASNANIKTAGSNSNGVHSESVVGGSSSGTASIDFSGNISALGEDSSGIYSKTVNGANTVLLRNNSNILGGVGKGAGITLSSVSGSQLLENYADVSALNDVALSTDNVNGSTYIDNYGQLTGIIKMTGKENTLNNNGLFLTRNFTDTNGDQVRDTKAVAISNFGGGNDVFKNELTGTVRLAAVAGESTVGRTNEYITSGALSINNAGIVQG